MRVEKPSVGSITSGLFPHTLALQTIDFVYRQLPAWRDDPNRPSEQSENKLNLQLCKYLNSKARNDFPMVVFDHEEYQSGRSSVDISASPNETTAIGAKNYPTHTIYDPIVVLECKRLPAPSRDREREYVTGGVQRTSGGIQRFKLGVHGASHDMAAMVGYLQDGSASDWHEKINRWIMELSNGTMKDACLWDTSEILGALAEDSRNGIADCRSTHNRGSSAQNNRILIRHLWITMPM
jgi:hypothetical protein